MKTLHAPRFEAPEAIVAGLAEQQYVAGAPTAKDAPQLFLTRRRTWRRLAPELGRVAI